MENDNNDIINDSTTPKPVNNQKQSIINERDVTEIPLSKNEDETLKLANNDNIITKNLVNFFEPLIKNLDSHVESLRMSQCELTAQIKQLLNRKLKFCQLL
jgi:hypothetical protein